MELGSLFRLILFNLLDNFLVKAYLSNSPHIITFWGQDPALQDANKVERALNKTCGPKSSYSTVVLGFVSKSIRNKTTASLPPMHCVKSAKSRSKLSLYCPEISKKVEQCKLNKKKVLIGVGGPNETLYFDDARSAQYFAKKIWNWFLGGTEISEMRPFGGIALDGVNIFLKDDKSKYVDVFLKTLNTLRNRVDDDDNTKYVYTMSVPCNAPEAYFGDGKNRLSLDKVVPIIKQIYVRYSGKQCCKSGPKHFRGELQEWKKFSITKDRPGLFVLFPRSPHKTMTNCFSSNRQLNILHNVVSMKTKLANFISKIRSLYQTNVRWRTAHLDNGTEPPLARDKIHPRYVELNTTLSNHLLQFKRLFRYPNITALSRQVDDAEGKINEWKDSLLFNDNYFDENKDIFKKRSAIKEPFTFKVPHMQETEGKLTKRSEIKLVVYISTEKNNKASSPKIDIDAIDLNVDGAHVHTPPIIVHDHQVTSSVDDMEVAGSGDLIIPHDNTQVTQYGFNESSPIVSIIDDVNMLTKTPVVKPNDRNSKPNRTNFMPMLDNFMDTSYVPPPVSTTRKKTIAEEEDITGTNDIRMEMAGSDQSDFSLGDIPNPSSLSEATDLSVKKMDNKYKADLQETILDALFEADDTMKTLDTATHRKPHIDNTTGISEKVKQTYLHNALERTSNINNYNEVLHHVSNKVRQTYLHNKLEHTANIYNYKEALKHNDNVKLANSHDKLEDEELRKQRLRFVPMGKPEGNRVGDLLPHTTNSNKDVKHQALIAADHILALSDNIVQFTNKHDKSKKGKTVKNENTKSTKHKLYKLFHDDKEGTNIGNKQGKENAQMANVVKDSGSVNTLNTLYTNRYGTHKIKAKLNNESLQFDNTKDVPDIEGKLEEQRDPTSKEKPDLGKGKLKEERDSTSNAKPDAGNTKDIADTEGKLKEEHESPSNEKSNNSDTPSISDIEGKIKEELDSSSKEKSDNSNTNDVSDIQGELQGGSDSTSDKILDNRYLKDALDIEGNPLSNEGNPISNEQSDSGNAMNVSDIVENLMGGRAFNSIKKPDNSNTGDVSENVEKSKEEHESNSNKKSYNNNARYMSDNVEKLKNEGSSAFNKKADHSNTMGISDIGMKLKEEQASTSNKKTDNSVITWGKQVLQVQKDNHPKQYRMSADELDNQAPVITPTPLPVKGIANPLSGYPVNQSLLQEAKKKFTNDIYLTLKMLMPDKYNPISLGDDPKESIVTALATAKRTTKPDKKPTEYTTFHRMTVPTSRDYLSSPSVLNREVAHLRHRINDAQARQKSQAKSNKKRVRLQHHGERRKKLYNGTIGMLDDRKYIIKRKEDEIATLLGDFPASVKSPERERASLIDKINKYRPLIMSNINDLFHDKMAKLKKQINEHIKKFHKNGSFADSLLSDVFTEEDSNVVREPKRKPKPTPVVVKSTAKVRKINKHKPLISSSIVDTVFEHKFKELKDQLKLHNIPLLNRRDGSSIEEIVHRIDQKIKRLRTKKKEKKHKSSNMEEIELGPVIDYFDYMDSEQENKKFRNKSRKLKVRANKRTSPLKGHPTVTGTNTFIQKPTDTFSNYVNTTLAQYDFSTLFQHLNFPDLRSAAIAAFARSLTNKSRSSSRNSKRLSNKQQKTAAGVKSKSLYKVNPQSRPIVGASTSNSVGFASLTPTKSVPARSTDKTVAVVDSEPINPPGLPSLNSVNNIPSTLINSNDSTTRSTNLLGYEMKADPDTRASSNDPDTYNIADYQKELSAASRGSSASSTTSSPFGPPTPISFLKHPSISNAPVNHPLSTTSEETPYRSPAEANAGNDLKESNNSTDDIDETLNAPPAPPALPPPPPPPAPIAPPEQPPDSSFSDPALRAVALNYLTSGSDPKLSSQALSHLAKSHSPFDTKKDPNFYQRITEGPDKKLEEFSTENPYLNSNYGAIIDFNYLNDTDYHKQPYANSNSDTVINFGPLKQKRSFGNNSLNSSRSLTLQNEKSRDANYTVNVTQIAQQKTLPNGGIKSETSKKSDRYINHRSNTAGKIRLNSIITEFSKVFPPVLYPFAEITTKAPNFRNEITSDQQP